MSTTAPIGREFGWRRAPPGAATTAVRDEVRLAVLVAGLLMAVIALSAVGAGAIARPLYMLAALVLPYFAKRRSPWLYLSASLWFWLTTAFVRRMIEWRSGYSQADIVLVTPCLTALLIVPDILGTRGLLTRRGIGHALLLTACTLYGLFVSFVRGDVLPGAMAATDWLVPLLYLFLFICHAGRIDEAEPHVGAFLSLSLPLLVPYAFYQYFLMPDWDAAWMLASGMGSLGRPLPMDSRIFGLLNSPLPLAIWGGTCVVLLAHFRTRLLLVLAPFLVMMVVLAMVRCVYGSVALALGVGALAGRGGFGRLAMVIVLGGLGGFVGMAVLDPHVTDQLTKRFQTFQNLDADDSAQVRRQIYAESPKLIGDNPLGLGIGAQGRGNAVKKVKDGTASGNVDSGPLSVFLALGWFAGPVYLFAMLSLQGRALLAGRRGTSPIASTMAAAAIVPLATFPFINIIGFNAVVLWICLGYVLAVEIKGAGVRARRAVVRAPPGRCHA